ncbi:MAG TPA: hypothetical protein VLL49_11205 [Anaerolineales bacterium]|nr:hypothetical protein [Anaerolineales bacterium]
MTRPRSLAQKLGTPGLADWTGPGLILAVCVFCFGILLSRLGYFQDDWHHVFFAYWEGAEGLKRFLLTDRGPFAWPVYAGFFGLLGFSPSAWHWSLMLLRFLTVLMFWLSARILWPGARSLAAWIGLLFSIYPIFTLQPLAVAYTLHWSMYLVFMVSLLLMLEAQRRPRLVLVLSAGALVLEVLHLGLIEYFAGLELARPLFLWITLRHLEPRDRLRRTARLAWPYLLILLLYAVYRSSYGMIFGFDRFGTLAALAELGRLPFKQLQGILQVALQDLVYVIMSPWHAAVEPALLDLSRPSTYLILGSMGAFAVLAYWAMTRADRSRGEFTGPGQPRQVMITGFVIVILSLLPFWLAGFSIYQKNQLWSERLALAAMPGASMVVVGGVFALVGRSSRRHLVLSALLGLAVGLQAQTARSFQASWDKQRQFYWQLNWRAPSLQPGTLIVADEEILFYMGIYPTSFAINMLYPQLTSPPLASYWFNAGFEHMNFDKFAAGDPDQFEKYGATFAAAVDNVVAITFEPGSGQCLWVLRQEVANARGLSQAAQTWLSVSNVTRIQDRPQNAPPRDVFGAEPERTWCYYFEKADLARQYQDWDEVESLWQRAQAAGLRPENGLELLPFIEASARTGAWQEAQAITRQAQVMPDRSTSAFCELWRELARSTAYSVGRGQALGSIQDDLACAP